MIKRGQTIELTIEDLAFGGKGIARIKDENGAFVLFVNNTFPGQKVLARITKKRKKHAECSLLKVLERSPQEIKSEYQEISGAPYIHVPPTLQEESKKKVTLEVYRRLADLQNIDDLFDEFIPSPEHYHYRNKMEYSFSCIEHDIENDEEIDDAFALGFKHRGTWWKVESLNKASGLFDPQWENFLKDFRTFLEQTNLPAWHPPKKEGFYRHIVVRKSFYEDKLLINLVTSSQGIENFDLEAIAQFLKDNMGDRIAGFQHTINDNVADRAKIENGDCVLAFGKDNVIEELNGLYFEISMESFFQTNPKSAERLYNKALDYVFEGERSLEDKVVMDLFCGTGTIGQLLTQRTKDTKIIGVDIVQEAIADAKRNAKRNNIKGIDFYAADVGKFLKAYPDYEGKIDTIVLDPPRAGIAPKTLKKVIQLGAERIVYISCNPSTQARDIKTLEEYGYKTKKISLVDQFPHTSHIEAVGLFEK
ncbi:23S rRNA (uracil(1939)-C(5))-methyltransferase RlmD [Brumimicrobium aurantiacum]|uniref:23S rRNA (Uracil(1939)-C(5))-methyltransferase RlmD n=1 Tax=Brumimicrobium aurantiacum TaxID=1737063 RepID=A0A3E1EW87_9FLAO|nr:23S rRNA (uracil(1939)-C(5))-methyltransferase RlmD [Brumimicrobium aurantiacum]RFC53821.1 23S rRNA (uracil(1939)-C(5))-methyltransferase RlmD [Brumimicrobium aurantiacum]